MNQIVWQSIKWFCGFKKRQKYNLVLLEDEILSYCKTNYNYNGTNFKKKFYVRVYTICGHSLNRFL